MKAYTKTKYGGPEVLQLEEVEKPSLKDGHILIKVMANSANPKDLEALATLIQAGKIKVHLEKTYSYKAIPEAIQYIEAMHTKGKVAMVWKNTGKED